MVPDIFHRDFKPIPYWWEAYTPTAGDLVEVPRAARVAIVGGGYAGLSTALELAKHGIDAVVLEADELGFGASTRNGGAVSGGVNIGKSFTGRPADVEPERAERLLSDASDAFGLIDRLIEEEKIDCFWEKAGRFVGTPADRPELLSWLFFVATGLGPFSGQAVHFQRAAPEKIPYAVNRYRREIERHYRVLDRHLVEAEGVGNRPELWLGRTQHADPGHCTRVVAEQGGDVGDR